ncbi:MAG: SRPBCC family protein [Chloroflexi bacterium]|nr:SRPBCC family protein [Chloroflexota bacterium]
MRMSGSVEIARPAAEVLAFVAEPENNTRWQSGMRECRWTTAPPHRVGSRYEQVASFLGRRIESTFEVTALDAGRSITIETRESTFPIRVTRAVHPLGEARCRVEASIEGGPGGPLRLLAPLMRLAAQRRVSGDYARLRRLLESADS